MQTPYRLSEECMVWTYPMPAIDSRMYVVIQAEAEEALVIDPNKSEEAARRLRENGIKSLLILLTHEHFDHISGVNFLRERFDCRVVCTETAARMIPNPNKNLAKFWDVLLMDKTAETQEKGMKVKDEEYGCIADETFSEPFCRKWQGRELRAELAPGHARGGAVYFLDDLFFSGDCLVNGAGVICRLPGGNWSTYCEKTRPMIEVLNDDTPVFPGHGNPARLADIRKYLVKFGAVPSEGRMK